MVLLFLTKIYKCDFRIIWEINSTETCKLQLHDIFTDPIFKNKVMIKFKAEKDKTYYYNNNISLKQLLLSAIPINQIDINTMSYKNTQVVVYDYYIMNKYENFIPNILDWIIPNELYLTELRDIQDSLMLNPNIEGFLNLYKKKRKDHFIIGLYIGNPNCEDVLQACVEKTKSTIEEVGEDKNVMIYVGFDDTIFAPTKISNGLQYLQTIFEDNLLYFNHKQGEGNLYSFMNLLCIQDSDLLLVDTCENNNDLLKIFTLHKSQKILKI